MAGGGHGFRLVGVGARTPLGLDAPSTAAAVRAGINAMADHQFVVDHEGEPVVVCADAKIPAEQDGVERYVALAVAPAMEAVRPLLQANKKVPAITLFVALPEERPGLPGGLEGAVAGALKARLAELGLEVKGVECRSLGHAGGLRCMEEALQGETGGAGELCLVGGVESYLPVGTLEWLDATEQLHSEATTWGYCPGEGSGFCLLASQGCATALGLAAPVELLSAASATEANRIGTDAVCTGEGLTEAFRKTLQVLPEGALVDGIVCDMNGVTYRADEFGFAMLRTRRWFSGDADSETPSDCWGDQGAASGCLFAVLTAFAAQKDYAPGPLTLAWASSDGGLRGAALFQSTIESS